MNETNETNSASAPRRPVKFPQHSNGPTTRLCDAGEDLRRVQRARETLHPCRLYRCQKQPVTGKPKPKHISTSYVERQNRTMRMSMRRFTRLTNAFSKKLENHIAAVSLHFMYYNFVRIHLTLKITPAMQAGVTDRLWRIEDIVKLVDEYREERVQQEREERNERSYSQFGDALGGKGLK